MDLQHDMLNFWGQGDIITHGVVVLLAVMSVASWSIIIAKSVQLGRLQDFASLYGNTEVVNKFWESASLEQGLTILKKMPPFLFLAEQALNAKQHYKKYHVSQDDHSLDASLTLDELVTRALRQGLNKISVQLDRGQIILASIGATAPFVGLLGTVWGIYHALTAISVSGQAGLDTVAGPVGEALIMTAFGLFVAIPAVLAYNAFTRTQQVIMTDLDGFAHDLQLYFSIRAGK